MNDVVPEVFVNEIRDALAEEFGAWKHFLRAVSRTSLSVQTAEALFQCNFK